MPAAPPAGYVYAVRARGVVNLPARTIGGNRIEGGVVTPGMTALVPTGEANASESWLRVTQIETIGSHTDAGVSVFGIDGVTGHAYMDDTGATAGEESLFTLRTPDNAWHPVHIVIDDLDDVE